MQRELTLTLFTVRFVLIGSAIACTFLMFANADSSPITSYASALVLIWCYWLFVRTEKTYKVIMQTLSKEASRHLDEKEDESPIELPDHWNTLASLGYGLYRISYESEGFWFVGVNEEKAMQAFKEWLVRFDYDIDDESEMSEIKIKQFDWNKKFTFHLEDGFVSLYPHQWLSLSQALEGSGFIGTSLE